MDFAGGIVVHATAGVSALVAAMMIGRAQRLSRITSIPPHSPGMTMAGAGMLWVGWFGFNGGSALAADAAAGMAILATHFAASAAALTWMAIEWLRFGKPTSVGIVTGCVAGLATITPASGFVGPVGAMAIGVAGGAVCFFATNLIKQRLQHRRLARRLRRAWRRRHDSARCSSRSSPCRRSAASAMREGMDLSRQFVAQLIGVLTAIVWSAGWTFALVKIVGAICGTRVSAEEESDGLDLATHGERAYDHT